MKMNKKPSIFKILKIVLPTIYRSSPVLFTISWITMVFHGLSWGVEALFKQRLFDSAAQFAEGKTVISSVILALAALGTVNVICQLLNAVGNFLPGVVAEKCKGDLSFLIHEKISRLSPATFEDTGKLDDINKAENGKDNAVWFCILLMVIITFYVPYFAFMGWYLFSLKPILAWSILFAFIPTALIQILRTKVFRKLEDASAPVRREYEYYENCMVGREYFKETRLLGGFSFFKKLYIDTLKILNALSLKATIKTNLAELGVKFLTVGGYAAILIMLFDALMKREITVGAFAAVFSSIGLVYGIMDEVICRHIGELAKNLASIQNYISFLHLEERTGGEETIQKDCDIVLDNVSFAYPKAEKNALSNVNLTIKNGETVAIVGENGSGKSTFIRLLTGLYLPAKGKVWYGRTSTDMIPLGRLFSGTSAVFQKYCRYQMLLSDNITISDTGMDADPDQMDISCRMAGFSKEDSCFTDGYDTMLSREFDGVDLSGGEWQRVAIARAFYRPHNMIILDEPTAAIDPFEETKIYNRFAKMSKGKTAVIVTHRLGSVKLADRIIVMKDGGIAETGTHEELLEKGGEYARMYIAQQKWYKE